MFEAIYIIAVISNIALTLGWMVFCQYKRYTIKTWAIGHVAIFTATMVCLLNWS